jgi:Ca2+-binding EF-hand superfamily protein
MRDQLKAADTDGNRSISRSEAEAGLPRLAENFAQVDDDRNGEVSAEELRKHLGRHDRKEFQAHAAERFAAADTDRNGALDLAEVQTGAPRLADRFTALDANNDGLLSREELQRSFERK